MIRLFISDIDGCLATPYTPFEIERLADLRKLIAEAGSPVNDGSSGSGTLHPPFTICSGRPYPYVEAMTQVLGITTSVLFESGAGMFDPVSAQSKWHPAASDGLFESIREIKSFLNESAKGMTASVDMAKQAQATLVGPDTAEIQQLYPVLHDYVNTNFPELQVFQTPNSIDIVQPGLTKREGVYWLADEYALSTGDLAFLGDTDGDLGALQTVGRSYAPANAAPEIKQMVDVSTVSPQLEGVFEAYKDAAQFGR